MVFAFTKAPVLVQGGGSAKHLSTVLAFNLRTAVSMHSFMATQVGELCVRFVADLTYERFDSAMNVLVLLET